MKIQYIVQDNQLTINQILKNKLEISSRLLYKLIKLNKITLNQKPCNTKEIVKLGDIITIDFKYDEDNSNIVPTKMNLEIIYEDDWFLIVNKPAKIAVHPSILHYSDSLCNGIKCYFDSINLKKKIRPVNRLDLNTSGLVIFAKCEYIQECLISQMKNKKFKKEYIAICDGILENKFGTINLPIARKENSIIERCISSEGQPSITHYEVLKEFNNYSLIKCLLETGRTHQIRVHMSAIGHPLVGDSLYGFNSKFIDRQALHCYKLTFVHPITKEYNNFISEIPIDFNNLLEEHSIYDIF